MLTSYEHTHMLVLQGLPAAVPSHDAAERTGGFHHLRRYVGLQNRITSGLPRCYVHELASTTLPKAYAFRGGKEYTAQQAP